MWAAAAVSEPADERLWETHKKSAQAKSERRGMGNVRCEMRWERVYRELYMVAEMGERKSKSEMRWDRDREPFPLPACCLFVSPASVSFLPLFSKYYQFGGIRRGEAKQRERKIMNKKMRYLYLYLQKERQNSIYLHWEWETEESRCVVFNVWKYENENVTENENIEMSHKEK